MLIPTAATENMEGAVGRWSLSPLIGAELLIFFWYSLKIEEQNPNELKSGCTSLYLPRRILN